MKKQPITQKEMDLAQDPIELDPSQQPEPTSDLSFPELLARIENRRHNEGLTSSDSPKPSPLDTSQPSTESDSKPL